jgi:hypothetical protein
MEKTVKLTRSEIIKWVILFAAVLSAFVANQYGERNNTRRIERLEIEVRELRECQSASASEIANMNGKLDVINENVNAIKDAIISRGLGRNN